MALPNSSQKPPVLFLGPCRIVAGLYCDSTAYIHSPFTHSAFIEHLLGPGDQNISKVRGKAQKDKTVECPQIHNGPNHTLGPRPSLVLIQRTPSLGRVVLVNGTIHIFTSDLGLS